MSLATLLPNSTPSDPWGYRVTARPRLAQLFLDTFGQKTLLCSRCHTPMDWELLYHPKYGILKEAPLFQDNPPMDEPNPSHPPWLQKMLAEIPWHAPSHWYNYRCHSCDHRDWVEDIIVDGFPPTEPEGCPALMCPECGGEFLWDASVPEQESYIKPESD